MGAAPKRLLGVAHRIARNSEILMKSPLPAQSLECRSRCSGYVDLNGELSQLKSELCIEIRLMMKTSVPCFLFRHREFIIYRLKIFLMWEILVSLGGRLGLTWRSQWKTAWLETLQDSMGAGSVLRGGMRLTHRVNRSSQSRGTGRKGSEPSEGDNDTLHGGHNAVATQGETSNSISRLPEDFIPAVDKLKTSMDFIGALGGSNGDLDDATLARLRNPP